MYLYIHLIFKHYRVHSGNWEKAHKLLKNNPTLTDLSEELETYGKKLENMGRIKEAEKLYIALEKIDLAINMYKNCQRYDEVRTFQRLFLCNGRKTQTLRFQQMMSLVSKYHSDLVSTTHVHLAHECETRGNYRAAEHHFVQAGEWKLAVKMYRSLDMWEEAYKVPTPLYDSLKICIMYTQYEYVHVRVINILFVYYYCGMQVNKV